MPYIIAIKYEVRSQLGNIRTVCRKTNNNPSYRETHTLPERGYVFIFFSVQTVTNTVNIPSKQYHQQPVV